MLMRAHIGCGAGAVKRFNEKRPDPRESGRETLRQRLEHTHWFDGVARPA